MPTLAATPRNTTVTAVGGPKYEINRFAADAMRWSKDSYTIKSGGTLTIRNRTREPHTLSVVKRSRLPRTRRQLDNCFPNGICGAFAGHEFAEGGEGGPGPPARPILDPDGKGLDEAGDSIAFSKSRVRVRVRAKRGRTLHFICIIHPWMQSKIRVR